MSLFRASSLLALPLALIAPAAGQPFEAAQVAEIAALLPDAPTGPGAPATDRAAWDALAARPEFAALIDQAASLADQPIPETTDELYLEFFETGNRTNWQRVAGQRRGRISTLALAECLEGRGRFIGPLQGTIRAICAEPTWVMPAHDRDKRNFEGTLIDIDLGSSGLAWQLATAYDLLGDGLEPDVRQLIHGKIRDRILDPFLAMVRGEREANWWMTATNNWNHVCLAGVVGSALAVSESPQERAEILLAGAHYSEYGLQGFTEDGYCSEGVGYWNYGFGHFISLAEMTHQATGGRIDLFQRDDVIPPAMYGARMEIAEGVYPAFADCSVNARPDSRLMSFLGQKYQLGLDDYPPETMVGPGGGLASAVLYSFATSAATDPVEEAGRVRLGLTEWFEEAGILISRAGDSKLAIAGKGGHNSEHHNHNDVGSYVVVVGGRAVLLDPGAETYT
ncbi:MAG: heparinase, partial [Armatimonadia bacterium]|nr:heparinase [Armatimonadia bacterium]